MKPTGIVRFFAIWAMLCAALQLHCNGEEEDDVTNLVAALRNTATTHNTVADGIAKNSPLSSSELIHLVGRALAEETNNPRVGVVWSLKKGVWKAPKLNWKQEDIAQHGTLGDLLAWIVDKEGWNYRVEGHRLLIEQFHVSRRE